MSTFDSASLVLIPSGYKASKVYSVKPTDGTGDLTFTRSLDTATRVGSDGLIEKVRTNLNLFSQDFTNAAYITAGFGVLPSVVANTTANPLNGAQDADTATFTAGATQSRLLQQFTGVGTVNQFTFSLYVKAGTKTSVNIFTNVTTTGLNASFNLSNGTIISQSAGLTASIISAGSGFFRCSVTSLPTTAGQLEVGIVSLIGEDGSLITFGAQLELSDFGATPYIPTTTAAVSVGMLANVPRLDYLGGGCPRLLLEPQGTNRAQFSEQFNNAFYTKDNVTISSNVAVSPDGFTNADKVVSTAANGEHIVYYFDSLNGGSGTISLFVKKAEYRYAILRSFIGTYAITVFDFDTLTFPVQTLGTGKAESYGNGWYRISVAFTLPVSGAYGVQFGFSPITDHVFTGDGTSGGFAYGFQFEQGSYATSYIPTLGAAVTRSADAASKTGISALIGQTEGTLYAEFKPDGTNPSARIIAVSDGTTANRIVLLQDGASIRVFVATASVGQVDISFGTWLGSHKIAVAYANNDLVVFLDGVLVATDTSISVPACSDAQVGTFEDNTNLTPLGGGIKQALLFKTRLTNAQLAELTA